MGIKKFIKKEKQTLGLISYEVKGKKKSLKDLLKKLNNRKKNNYKTSIIYRGFLVFIRYESKTK